jgi:hypothetical protein
VTTAAAYHVTQVWALPFSLATTQGVEVSFLSSGYSDVSVHRLASTCPMYSGMGTRALPRVGFPIRKSRDQRLVSTSPRLIAAAHVLHRLLAPRHPPCALILLIRKNTFVMSLWSFQGARARSASRTRSRPEPVSQNSAAYDMHTSRSTYFQASSVFGRPKPSTTRAATEVIAPESLERR